ncbi:hypothetical protein G9C98_007655 [Cotesia typhae]|uniref:Uncharacterized protein n=1 Tax=Cotesia typhae TaxID=2053667 RepID=A0A8J5V5P9_9HYME|nr:hypothetical protein G9C98_007655 [Cotesia typhae]
MPGHATGGASADMCWALSAVDSTLLQLGYYTVTHDHEGAFLPSTRLDSPCFCCCALTITTSTSSNPPVLSYHTTTCVLRTTNTDTVYVGLINIAERAQSLTTARKKKYINTLLCLFISQIT